MTGFERRNASVPKGVHNVVKTLASGRKVTYWYAWRGGPRLVGQPGSPEFEASYKAANAMPLQERVYEGAYETVPPWMMALFQSAQKRAQKKGLAFDLTPADLLELASRCKGRCEVTGHPFRHQNPQDLRVRPFAPSLDRKDSKQGYTIGNVRLVLYIVNVAMQDWGEKPLLELFAHMAVKAKRRIAG